MGPGLRTGDPHRPHDVPAASLRRGSADGLSPVPRRGGGAAGHPQSGRAAPRDRRERRHGPDLGYPGGTAALERRSLRTRNRSLLRAAGARAPDVQSRWNPPVLRALRWAQGQRRRHHNRDHVPLAAPSVPGRDEGGGLPAHLRGLRFTHLYRVLRPGQSCPRHVPAERCLARRRGERCPARRASGAAGSHVVDQLGGVQRRRHTTRDRKPRRNRPGVGHVDRGPHLHLAGRTERRRSGRVQSRRVAGHCGLLGRTGSSSIRSHSRMRSRSPRLASRAGFTDEECRRYLHVPGCPAD